MAFIAFCVCVSTHHIPALIIQPQDKGALTALILADNNIESPVGWMIQPGNVPEQRYKHTDGRMRGRLPEGEQLGKPEGVIAVANAIKEMGAVSLVNLLKNGIGVAQAETLAGILRGHSTLKSLCGNIGNETELDMSRQNIGAAGAIMLGPEIAGNRALLSLDISNNKLTRGNAMFNNDRYNARHWETDLSGI
jgi:hypothetical protein